MKDTNFKNFSFILLILLVLFVTFGYVVFFTPISRIPVYTDSKIARYRNR